MDTEKSVYTLENRSSSIDIEQNRLDSQHWLLLKQTNGQLLPDRVARHLSGLACPPKVADIATGTGVWIRHLATQLPADSRLDGYDFSTSKFYNAAQLASNINLRCADVLEPFPSETLGIYDLVHVRALMYALREDQWANATANLRTLLRPGGYLLWEDVGYPTWQCLPMTKSFMKWIRTEVQYAASIGRDIAYPLHLKDHIESAGFVNCMQQEFSTYQLPQSEQEAVGIALVSGAKQSMYGIVDRGGYEWLQKVEDADELAIRIRADFDSGMAQVGWTLYSITAQNPSKG